MFLSKDIINSFLSIILKQLTPTNNKDMNNLLTLSKYDASKFCLKLLYSHMFIDTGI